MGLMNRKFTSKDIKKAQKDMIACPFCASDKVKLTTVSKGASKGDKVQGMCNVCYGRGPAVADDPYKAVELWNKRLLYDNNKDDCLVLDEEQMKKFMNGEILLNTRTQLEYNSVIYYFGNKVNDFDVEQHKYLWNSYKDKTVVDAMSSIIEEKKLLFGYCDIDWYKKKDTRPIETLKINKGKAKK